MKGPKPVWILATNRLNQSRPRPALAISAVCGFAEWSDPARTAVLSLLTFRGARCGGRRGDLRRHQCLRMVGVLVFRRRLQFLPVHAQSQKFILVAGREAQQRPVDGDAANPHAEKAAEFDDGDAYAASGIGQYVDHAANVLALRILHFLAEDRHDGTVEGPD